MESSEVILTICEDSNGKILSVSLDLPVLATEKDGYFLVKCPQLKTIGTSNISLEEAKKDHHTDLNIFFQIHAQRGTLKGVLESLGWERVNSQHWESPKTPSYYSDTILVERNMSVAISA